MGALPWGNSCIWHKTLDGTPSLTLLGQTHHVGLCRALLWNPIQRLQGGHARGASINHYLQYSGRHSDPTLRESISGKGVRATGFREGGIDPGHNILCRWWDPSLPTDSQDPGGPWNPYGTIWPGWTEDECQQYVWHDLPIMSHIRLTFQGHVQSVDDRGGIILKGKTTGAVKVTGMRDESGGQFQGSTPLEPEWPGKGPPVGRRPAATSDPMDVPGLLIRDRSVSDIPSRGHRWELPGNYPVFTMVMVIYHYAERIWRVLVTPKFLYNIYDNE